MALPLWFIDGQYIQAEKVSEAKTRWSELNRISPDRAMDIRQVESITNEEERARRIIKCASREGLDDEKEYGEEILAMFALYRQGKAPKDF